MKSGLVYIAIGIMALACGSCATGRKAARIGESGLSASISLPADMHTGMPVVDAGAAVERDTIKVEGIDGREVLIMRAVKDEQTGEMVATEQIDAAVVSARFRNVAERHGRIDLEFQITVPPQMHDSRWQLRFHPDMYILDDSLRLDDVIITGSDYRKAQLRGYQQYERFVSRIVNDTLRFVNMHELEVFLERNLPEVYRFRTDSSYVSDEAFSSSFGVTESQAVEHYTNMLAWRMNERRRGKMDKMWHKYVKSPIVKDGIRLDTVLRTMDGDFIYRYVQTIETRPRLRKVDIRLGGEIYESDRRIYTIPVSDPLTFYISSVSTLADDTERYLTKIITRNVEARSVSYISFEKGSSEIKETLGDNMSEIAQIKNDLRNLLVRKDFGLDSIVTVASASPEGSFRTNNQLSYRRSLAVSGYFSEYVAHVRDSLIREAGVMMTLDDEDRRPVVRIAYDGMAGIDFISRSGGENWSALDALVLSDPAMTESEKEDYESLAGIDDPDQREKALSVRPYYRHVADDLYPKLRTVVFNSHLHRVGMQKDTVQTTVLDTVYMSGVRLLRDHDYEAALEKLGPYQDLNTAIAYVALDRNLSASSILEKCPSTARVNYMLAIVHARLGDERKAIECYVKACELDQSFIHRGNLDPEISSLVKRYNVNQKIQ